MVAAPKTQDPCARLSRVAVVASALTAMSCISSSAFAAVNAFSTVGPEGGMMTAVAYHPTDPSIAYLGGYSGFYRSIDAGHSWVPVSDTIPNGVRDIAVHPQHPSKVFAAGSGVYVSEDSGASLLQLSTVGEEGSNATQIEYSHDGAVLYVLSSNRVLRSADGGSTWVRGAEIAPSLDFVSLLRADPATRDVLYAGSNDSAFRSTDGGATWTVWNRPAGSASFLDLAFSNTSPRRAWAALSSGLWFSDNEGVSWSQSSLTTTSVSVVLVDPNDASIVYASGFREGLVRSEDNGATWVPIPGTQAAGVAASLARRPGSVLHMLYTGKEGTVGTDDGGSQWTSRNAGVLGTTVYELVASQASDRTYVSLIEGGIHYVEGDAAAVAVNNAPLRQFGASQGFDLTTRGLFVHPGQPDRLMVGVPRGIARSADAGQTWQLLTNADFLASPILRIAATSADGQNLLAAGHRKLFRSTNGGDTWATVAGITALSFTSGLVAAPSNPSTLYLVAEIASSQYSVLKSTDAGLSWQATTPLPVTQVGNIVVDPRDDRIVYAITTQSLWRSRDGGESWLQIIWAPVNRGLWGFAIDPTDPDILYAANFERTARSVDAGATWEALPAPDDFPFWDPRALSVDAARPHRLLLAANGDGLKQIDIQPDLEITAQSPATPVGYGQPVTITYTVRNKGPFDATGVRTQVGLSGSATGVVATMPNGTCTGPATAVVCESRILRVGATTTVTVSFIEPAAGDVRIPATVEGAQPDAITTDNSTASDLVVKEVADVSVTATGPASVTEGDTATYTITVSNAGPNSANAVQVAFRAATGLGIATVTPSAGTCSTASGTVTCNIETLAASANATITIATTAVGVGSFQSTLDASSSGTDLVMSNNARSIATTGAPKPPPPPPPPPPASSGGGGGGGSLSLMALVALLVLSIARSRRRALAVTAA